MNKFLAACGSAAAAAIKALRVTARVVLAWLSRPLNACLAAIGLAFLVSFLSWAIGDRYSEAVLFFPDSKRGDLVGELRDLPRRSGRESRAELLASELLLGPRSSGLDSPFPAGIRVESSIYRRRRLYIDLSPEAALAKPEELKKGLEAMRRSLSRGLPGLKDLVLTIGGREPYATGLEAGNDAKIQKDN